MARKPKHSATTLPIPTQLAFPPRTVLDEQGQTVGVILAYDDYKTFLRILAAHVDWEILPTYLQDAIDNVLADEALAEEGASRPLHNVTEETAS